MRVTFEIRASLLDSVKELSDKLSKSMQELTGDKTKILIVFKIGEVTVTVPETETKESVRLKFMKYFKEKLTKQEVWLEEVAYEKSSQSDT